MEGIVCGDCHMWLTPENTACPGCGIPMVLEGEGKNIIDRLEPNCLIHRYEGSDMLEPAVLLKEGKTNHKVAARLQDYAKPVIVPKHKVYRFDASLLGTIQGLRNERTATVNRYDILIQSHWKKLQPY